MDFPMEPYKIKVVEPISRTTREERVRILEEAGYNLFSVPAEKVTIDLLTDSGTSAMSDNQWAGLMIGDESYAGCRNWFHLLETIQDITGYRYVLPTHQGRSAENILLMMLIQPGQSALGNMFFDTTHAHVETKGGFLGIWSSTKVWISKVVIILRAMWTLISWRDKSRS